MKNQKFHNPNLSLIKTNKPNSELTMDDWYRTSFALFSKMLNKNNINDIVYSSVPYYGKKFNSINGDQSQFRTDLKEIEGVDVGMIKNIQLAYNNLGYRPRVIDSLKDCEYYISQNLTKNIQFGHTDSDLFRMFLTQLSHETYVWKEGGKLKSSSLSKYYQNTLWEQINFLKGFLSKLKQTPFVDENDKQVLDKQGNKITVYDKSMITIISDHGFSKENYEQFNTLADYLQNKGWFSKTIANQLKNYDYYSYNPTMMFKNYKYDKNNNLIENQNTNFFNYSQILTLSDFSTIIENLIKRYNGVEDSQTFFWDDSIIDQNLSDLYLKDPLNEQTNSLNTNRKVIFTHPSDWRYYNDSKYVNFRIIYEFNSNANNFYNNDYYKKRNN